MKHRSSSLLQGMMAFLLLLVQLAGSSPELHDTLHGSPSCGDHHDSCGNDPSDKEDNACNETCAVVLLSNGVALPQVIPVPLLEAKEIAACREGQAEVWPTRIGRTTPARAPPVL